MPESRHVSRTSGDADSSASPAGLGDMLAGRRIQIDPRYKNRELFITERGQGISRSVFIDLETRGRTNFEAATIVALGVIYELPPGWLAAALAGDLRPLPPYRHVSPADVARALASLGPDADAAYLAEIRKHIGTGDYPAAARLIAWAALEAIESARSRDRETG